MDNERTRLIFGIGWGLIILFTIFLIKLKWKTSTNNLGKKEE